MSIFNFRNNFDLTCGKYLIKNILEITIEFGIFEISYELNLNKFEALIVLEPIWAWQVVNNYQKSFLTSKSRSAYQMCFSFRVSNL